jgi:hypothetical protein
MFLKGWEVLYKRWFCFLVSLEKFILWYKKVTTKKHKWPQDWFPLQWVWLILFCFVFWQFCGKYFGKGIFYYKFSFFINFNFFPIIVTITYNMLWMDPWNFLYSYLYYQKNWLNILIDDPLLSKITKLEPKRKKKKKWPIM